MSDAGLTRLLKARAIELGFDRVGVAGARTPPDYDRFREWLAVSPRLDPLGLRAGAS